MNSQFVFSAQGVNNLQQAKKPPDPNHPPQKISFRDKLLGPSQELPIRGKEDMIEKKLVHIELEDGNRLLPKVHIQPQVFQELCTPWNDALVIKLLGKNIGYNTMKERLQKIWKLQGGFEIMDNDNGFYMVKFDQAADKEKVITGGPWLIFDHCLAVTHWSPDFASPNARVDRTVVWVRFPGLNLVYYDESFLLAMASAIGRPIKVDTNTLKVERGKFARVCVEIDLTLPVVGKIWVNGHWYKVQYEGLHLICTNCGCYGHLGRNCSSTTESDAQVKQLSQQPSTNQHEPKTKLVHQTATTIQTHSMATPQKENTLNGSNDEIPIEKETKMEKGKSQELHGDWLLVTRRKKNQYHTPSIDSKTATQKVNRFNPLAHHSKLATPRPKAKDASRGNPPRPKQNDASRGNNTPITTHYETKKRRQVDHHFTQNTTHSLPHKNSIMQIPIVPQMPVPSQTFTHTYATKNSLSDPHQQEHVDHTINPQLQNHTNQLTLPHNTNPTRLDQPKASLSLTNQNYASAQEKTNMIPLFQSNTKEDTDEGNITKDVNHDSPTLCEEDMVT